MKLRAFSLYTLALVSFSIVYLWRSLYLYSRLPESSKDPHFDFVKNRTATADDSTVSACLLVLDDNHLLIEWLAYHYHTLPLRHLIISVDPRSRTSPRSILQRYDHLMDIQEWSDEDFMNKTEKEQAEAHASKYFRLQQNKDAALIQHRARQRLFYFKCMKHFKEQGRDWVVLIDTDEFLHVNYPTVNELQLNAPGIMEPGSVRTFLQHELERPGQNLTTTPCVQIPRIRYGAEESTPHQVARRTPEFLNASLFQTLRWRKHASPYDHTSNKISKTMIDLSRVPWQDLQPVDSVHRPIRSMCGHRRLYIQSHHQVFLINHYLGTLEQYSYRNDSRVGRERSQEEYKKYQSLNDAQDDEVRPWLHGFVRENGHDVAAALLKGVGELEKV
jgi:hypothetical protein